MSNYKSTNDNNVSRNNDSKNAQVGENTMSNYKSTNGNNGSRNNGSKNAQGKQCYGQESHIDISSVYLNLKEALITRARLQESQDLQWRRIREGYDCATELNQLAIEMGSQTDTIHQLIAQLAKYANNHEAMSMACNYLRSEITRIDKILSSPNISMLKGGGMETGVDSHASIHTDFISMSQYIQQKEQQRARFENWLTSISRYA